MVSHAVNDFCVVDLSAFYFDIIKDRLYCGDEAGRRSARTALWIILDTMTRLFAPILAFTCDEIWLSMPHREGDDPRNVVLNEMNKPFTDYALDEEAMAKWDQAIDLRDVVLKALEESRAKGLKKNQDAEVVLTWQDTDGNSLFAAGEGGTLLPGFSGADLATLFIVSRVTAKRGGTPGLSVEAYLSEAPKCPRCWNHDEHIGTPGHHAELCARCAKVLGV